MDNLKENVVRRSCEWRDAQKQRIATRDPQMKERAKSRERLMEKKLAEAVDNYQNKGAADE